ncbi:MAG: OmpH family outer membrane protein [Pseudomonadota bacterium]|nr:OmpH family outer membrane protein [Pseudomonadota bacterium]
MKKTVVLLSSLFATTVFADSSNVGVVSLDKVLTTSKPSTLLYNAVADKFAPVESQLSVMNSKLDGEESALSILANQLKSNKNKPSEGLKKDFSSKYSAYLNDLQQFKQAYKEYKYAKEQVKDYANIEFFKQLNSISQDFSKTKQLSALVTDENFIYVDHAMDVTDSYIDAVNKKVDVTTVINQINKM